VSSSLSTHTTTLPWGSASRWRVGAHRAHRSHLRRRNPPFVHNSGSCPIGLNLALPFPNSARPYLICATATSHAPATPAPPGGVIAAKPHRAAAGVKGRQSDRVRTSRGHRTLPPMPHEAGDADRSKRGLPPRSRTTKGFRVSTRSTVSGSFRRSGFVTRRLGGCYGVRTRSATWLAAFTGALDGTIEPEFRTVPGFSNQRDREIEHRRHLTPPTID
jgi:hypothetical protein